MFPSYVQLILKTICYNTGVISKISSLSPYLFIPRYVHTNEINFLLRFQWENLRSFIIRNNSHKFSNVIFPVLLRVACNAISLFKLCIEIWCARGEESWIFYWVIFTATSYEGICISFLKSYIYSLLSSTCIWLIYILFSSKQSFLVNGV